METLGRGGGSRETYIKKVLKIRIPPNTNRMHWDSRVGINNTIILVLITTYFVLYVFGMHKKVVYRGLTVFNYNE